MEAHAAFALVPGHATDQIEYQGSGHALDVPHGVIHLEVDPEAGHGSEGHHDGMLENKYGSFKLCWLLPSQMLLES